MLNSNNQFYSYFFSLFINFLEFLSLSGLNNISISFFYSIYLNFLIQLLYISFKLDQILCIIVSNFY